MRKYLQSPWFWPVVGFVILLVLTRGQVLMALGPLSKFIIPLAGGYLLYRFIKKKVRQSLAANINKTMSEFAQAQRQAQENIRYYQQQGQRQSTSYTEPQEASRPVIEICPTCGEPKKPACPNCK